MVDRGEERFSSVSNHSLARCPSSSKYSLTHASVSNPIETHWVTQEKDMEVERGPVRKRNRSRRNGSRRDKRGTLVECG